MQKTSLVTLIALMFMLSIFLQTHMQIHWNMLYIIEAGKRLLAHGTLLHDVFDPNPPLIFYSSKLIHYIALKCSVSEISIFRAIQFIGIMYALATVYYLLPKKHLSLIMLTLAFCLLILPVNAFAEREHWMITLSMPYFFLLYQRAEGINFKPLTKLSISAIAALGLCLKPYFFLSIICAELLILYWKKDWRWIFRIETCVLLFTILAYLGYIAYASPEYYQEVLPKIIQWYAFNNSPLFVLKHEVFLSFVILSVYFLIYRQHISRMDALLFAIATGFALSFFLQGKGWFYQALPLMTLTTLLTVLFVSKNQRAGWLLLYLQCTFIFLPVGLYYYQQIDGYRRYQPLIEVIKTHQAQHQPIYFFTTLMSESIPVIHYSSAHISSRFPFMWPLSGIINRQFHMGYCDLQCEKSARFIREAINDDLQHTQPLLVFVDVRAKKAYLPINFNYLTFMQHSPKFNSIWKHYRYINTVTHYAVYLKVIPFTNKKATSCIIKDVLTQCTQSSGRGENPHRWLKPTSGLLNIKRSADLV